MSSPLRTLSVHTEADEIIAQLAARGLGRYERIACEAHGCIAPAPFKCAWPVEREVIVAARTLEIGDVWVTEQTRKHGRIVGIEHATLPKYSVRSQLSNDVIRFHVMIPGFGKAACTYDRHPDYGKGVITLRPAPCGAYACERHVREVDERRHYCAAHWHAWEGVS